MIMTAVATVSLAAPSAALAHNGERHHHHRGRHHNHAHVLAFHAQAPSSPSTATPPATPMPGESAGTIASFSAGTLTITLNDGSTVSGKVTERTEIECPATTAGAARFDDNDRGDDNGFENSPQDGSSGPGNGRGDCPGHDERNGEQGEHCTSAALVQGASVKEAFLSVSSQGAEWVKVEL
jgi:hypothetical protein